MQISPFLRKVTKLCIGLTVIATPVLSGCGGGGTPPVAANIQMGGAIQGSELNLTTSVTTLAGSGSWGGIMMDGTGMTATFGTPLNITTDGNNLYVADSSNHRIRKIVLATGSVTTLAGNGSYPAIDGIGTMASFYYPGGITTDGNNLYVADTYSHKIRKVVIASGLVSTLAGTGTVGLADGSGASASFNYPGGITTDGSNLYISDTVNNKIRKIVIASGVVTTLAGSGLIGSADGTGTAATFNTPRGITTDGTNLYVADVANNVIRKIVIVTGVVTTLAGNGANAAVDGTGVAASFYYPYGITTDGINLYIADDYNEKIRKIVIATGAVTTLAGSGLAGAANGTGSAASFYYPNGITTDGISLYVGDSGNHNIRKIH